MSDKQLAGWFHLTQDEAEFLLVLLSEEETITKRMAELQFPLDKVDLHALADRMRTRCWDFHQQDQTALPRTTSAELEKWATRKELVKTKYNDESLSGLHDVMVDAGMTPNYDFIRNCLIADEELFVNCENWGASDTEVREYFGRRLREGAYDHVWLKMGYAITRSKR